MPTMPHHLHRIKEHAPLRSPINIGSFCSLKRLEHCDFITHSMEPGEFSHCSAKRNVTSLKNQCEIQGFSHFSARRIGYALIMV